MVHISGRIQLFWIDELGDCVILCNLLMNFFVERGDGVYWNHPVHLSRIVQKMASELLYLL